MQIGACTLFAVAACSYSPPVQAVDASTPPLDVVDTPVVPWLHPWQHRKAFSLLASEVDGALTDFPVLVSALDADISGANIAFTLGDAVTPLAAEIESVTGGRLIAWVKIPSLDATVDTPLYIYYGNPSPPPADPVWTASFLGVWHLQESPTAGNGEMLDATAAGRDGDAEASMTATSSVDAQIGRGIDLDGVDDFIDIPTADFGNAFTIAMWIRADNVASGRALLANSASGDGVDGFRLFLNTVGTTDRRIVFETGNAAGNAEHAQTPSNAIQFGAWTYVTVVVDRPNGRADLFVDGVRTTERTNTLTNFKVNSDFELGRMENDFFKFSGVLDEVEIASALRSTEWIETAFNNQHSPDAFHTPFGPAETAP